MDDSKTPELTVDCEFRDLIRPLLKDEYRHLEAALLADGCREPITVWKGIIVDGHNRYEICRRLGIPFEFVSDILTIGKKLSSGYAQISWDDAIYLTKPAGI